MMKNLTQEQEFLSPEANKYPSIKKLGIVSRDYNHKIGNGFRDFSSRLKDILKFLDEKGCDAVLFSLFSIPPREFFNPHGAFCELKNVKSVFLEEYQDLEDKAERKAGRFTVFFHKNENDWGEHSFTQKFARLAGTNNEYIEYFVKHEMPERRFIENYGILLCGETNGVKYSKKCKKIIDCFGLSEKIPEQVRIILNPIHDRMTRFEMRLKRKFLSEDGRCVVSVWNKGKKDRNGVVRDGNNPAWTAYYNGQEISILKIEANFEKIEIGILDLGSVLNI